LCILHRFWGTFGSHLGHIYGGVPPSRVTFGRPGVPAAPRVAPEWILSRFWSDSGRLWGPMVDSGRLWGPIWGSLPALLRSFYRFFRNRVPSTSCAGLLSDCGTQKVGQWSSRRRPGMQSAHAGACFVKVPFFLHNSSPGGTPGPHWLTFGSILGARWLRSAARAVLLSARWLRSAARAAPLNAGGSEVLNIRVFACFSRAKYSISGLPISIAMQT
jgi:hypothetical protein